MPIQVIVPEGILTTDAEAEVFGKLTDLLLRLHGLTGNAFMTPNIIGDVAVVPKGRTFSGGRRADIAVVELKVPSFVLPTQELKNAWVSEVTTIIEQAAQGRIRREHIFANVVHAIDGTWGIGGTAYDNGALGAAISAKAA
ncbi:MAG: Tautomerase enzyme [Proteobacteria bacterium SG_bin9]|nr:MAG: Tautomerase enzyme [Proteobacteria bacterium SG_bin9]